MVDGLAKTLRAGHSIQDPSIFPGRHDMRTYHFARRSALSFEGAKFVFSGISSPNANTGQAVCFWRSVVLSASTYRAFWVREPCSIFGLLILTAQCVKSVMPSDSIAESGLDLVDVHTMPKKAKTSAAAPDVGPRTRSRSVQNTVGEAPLTAEQEERNIQAALAQTAKDVAARKVARATLKRRARLHNLKIKEMGGDGHCLQYSVQDQLAQQGIDGQTMQVLRPAMAAFIGEKADYFQQFLIAEDCERKAWKRLLYDIRHSVGNAKRWGGDLEISALSCMFQCPIQYITSRQSHEFDELVTIKPHASLHGWWRKFIRQNNLAVDFNLKPLTLIYEEERHWQSSELLTPQVGTSAAGRTALATPGFSEGVLGAEEPAMGAPSGKARGKSTSSSAPISALPGPPNGSGRLSRSNSRSNTVDPGPLSQASGSNVPVSLLPRPRVNDNIFPGLSSGSDGEYCTWLGKNKLAPLLGASSYKRFDAGSFQGTFINPSLYSALGARWRPNAPTSNQFVHAGLSAAIRSQALNFSPTH